MKTEVSPQPIYLKDYREPDFWIPKVHLTFELGELATLVRSKLTVERNSAAANAKAPLVLNGEGLSLKRVAVDGRELSPADYHLGGDLLTLMNLPDRFTLEIENEIHPETNLSCEGLYKSGGSAGSGGIFCTQCEAESFRKITYFLDRPDVMSTYTVVVRAEKAKYPILLSNGNPVSRRDLDNGRHEVVWEDPFKKPCYLFALVAGDMGVLEDTFRTRSGRDVKLQIFARKGLEDRCRHAMDSLKWAMKWDEETYGLEYDLDIYMIVVAEDFNMGAMENKGLNVFNANYILAKPETATDADYDAISAVVAHEYFHNWTGNRITCRDWFQLSLKEGLTVFRDQRFSADHTSEAVKRIEDVIRLRTNQFAEDAGPMAHPVRPESYISINNFYTLTVYEKGAEVIRMIETLLSREGFRRGMDLYFKRHDGQAVTTDDFVAAMADANGADLKQFKNWYSQAGTPLIKVQAVYDAASREYRLTIEQSCAPSPGQAEKKSYHIPIAVGLIGKDGRDLTLQLKEDGQKDEKLSSGDANQKTIVLHLREPKQSFVFTGVDAKPVLSLLRKFSAPVKAEFDYSDEELAFLMAHDSDSFARWEAAQMFVVRVTRQLVEDAGAGRKLRDTTQLAAAFAPLLKDAFKDPSFTSFMLNLPAEQYLAQFYKEVDVDAIFAAREHMMASIANTHRATFESIYNQLVKEGTDGIGQGPSGRRSLKSRALEYLTIGGASKDLARALAQFRSAKNMTDELGALSALNRLDTPERTTAMQEFYAKWKDETLVMNKWLAMQAIAPFKSSLDLVKKLSGDPVFDKNNPNKIYALYVAFSRFNLLRFHDLSGDSYRFIADQIMDIDSRNPQVASRLMGAFSQWKSMTGPRQALMQAELKRVLAKPGLSNNVFEIASKTLQ